MDDIFRHLGVVTRTSTRTERDGKTLRLVIASRDYETGIDDLWDAVTSAERIPRWFMPIEGDLRLGGRYQLIGNAGGEITRCEPPRRLSVTWEFAGNVTWVDVVLEAQGEARTTLTMEHAGEVPPEFWDQYGPGATGVGWDLGLLGLGLHVEGGGSVPPEESAAWMASAEGKSYVRGSSDAWREAAVKDGENAVWADDAAERTRKFYTGES